MNKSIARYGSIEAYEKQLERNRVNRRKKYHESATIRANRLNSSSEWKKNNRPAANASWQSYRARQVGAGGKYGVKDVRLLLSEQGNKCPGCLSSFTDELKHTVDHFYPLYLGGSNAPDNLQLLCLSCNTSKWNRTWGEWMAFKGIEVG